MKLKHGDDTGNHIISNTQMKTKRMLFNGTRQYNILIFNKKLFFSRIGQNR